MYPSFKSFYSNPTPYINQEDELEDSAKDAAKKTVDEIMVKRVITATPETNVLKIGGMMIATGIHRVPVVDNGKVVGMVSRGTIYRAVLKATFPKLRD
jgi:CBS domain-containing protein